MSLPICQHIIAPEWLSLGISKGQSCIQTSATIQGLAFLLCSGPFPLVLDFIFETFAKMQAA